jgi:hypothetical protein
MFSKILEVHSCFWRRESLPELPKNPFWDFGPLGVKESRGIKRYFKESRGTLKRQEVSHPLACRINYPIHASDPWVPATKNAWTP